MAVRPFPDDQYPRDWAAASGSLPRWRVPSVLEQLRVALGCLRNGGAFANDLEGIVGVPTGREPFRFRAQRVRLELGRHLRTQPALIAHSFDFYSNLMMIPSARLARVPVVIGSQRQLGDLMSGFRNWAQHAVFRWCDRVVCNSRAAARAWNKLESPREDLP